MSPRAPLCAALLPILLIPACSRCNADPADSDPPSDSAPPEDSAPTDSDPAPDSDTADSADSAPPCDWGQAEPGQLVSMALEHDGVERSFGLHLPSDYDCTPRPVIVGLHGYYGSGAGFARSTSRMDERIDELGYVGLFPDGLAMGDSGWRAAVTSFNDIDSHNSDGPDGPTCTDSAYDYGIYDNCPKEEAQDACNWGTSCADDEGFLRAMLAMVQAQWSVDSDRIYLTGFSQGGQTVQSLGWRMADIFAAIAPHHGFAANGYTQAPSNSVGLFQVWASDDRTVNGTGMPSADGMIYDSAEETRLAWAEAQGCVTKASAFPTAYDGIEAWTCQQHEGCSTGAQVISCVWVGGHTWGRTDKVNFALEAMLEHFAAHSFYTQGHHPP